MRKTEVTLNMKVHTFMFNDSSDDPGEGATLTGVRHEGSWDEHQLRPSEHAEPAAWDAANRALRVGPYWPYRNVR